LQSVAIDEGQCRQAQCRAVGAWYIVPGNQTRRHAGDDYGDDYAQLRCQTCFAASGAAKAFRCESCKRQSSFLRNCRHLDVMQADKPNLEIATGSIGSAMLLVSSGIFASRILGLIRDMVFAHVWGTGTTLAAFIVAFTIPNLLRALLGEGAFSAAFVPVFTEHVQKYGRCQGWQRMQPVVTAQLVALSAIALVVSVGSVALAPFITAELPLQVLRLLPSIMPYAVLICLSVTLCSALQSLGLFAVAAFTPVLLNVVLTAAALLAAAHLGSDGLVALTVAVLLAGALQAALPAWRCWRAGLMLRLPLKIWTPEVQRVTRLMAPAMLGLGVMQLNVVVDRLLAMTIGSMATTALYYSQRLVYLPVGLFGVAMSMAALPSMARSHARAATAELLQKLWFSLRHALFLALPTLAIMAVLARPIIALLFERGSFDAAATDATWWALIFYIPGIPAFVAAKILVSSFYARQDTRTPVRIAMICLGVNVLLNLVLMQFLDQGGLALATTLCSFLNCVLLLRQLSKIRAGALPWRQFGRSFARVGIATAGATAAAWLLLAWVGQYDAFTWQQLCTVLLPLVIAVLVYALLAELMQVPEWISFRRGLTQRWRRRRAQLVSD